ncbi:MAG: alpha/beta hydrolase [Promethearchaeota archaeon]
MVESEKILIKNKEIKLEAEYFQSKTSSLIPIVLICHPHPQFGGNMYNNVVSAVFELLKNNHISTLRFNFRGVGKSNGSHTSGEGELSDVKACIDFLINQKGLKKIFLCGYSYGAAIGCSAVNYSDSIIGYCAISFPWDFIGIKYKQLTQTEKPKLFIQGDRDTIADYSRFNHHFDFYLNPKKYVIIEGADHFYWGYEDRAANIMLDYYNSII